MSDSLRARLKQCSRYYISPVTPKRPCSSESSTRHVAKLSNISYADCQLESSACSSPSVLECKKDDAVAVQKMAKEDVDCSLPSVYDSWPTACEMSTMSAHDLRKIKLKLHQNVLDKEEIFRKLNLVKIHRQKVCMPTWFHYVIFYHV